MYDIKNIKNIFYNKKTYFVIIIIFCFIALILFISINNIFIKENYKDLETNENDDIDKKSIYDLRIYYNIRINAIISEVKNLKNNTRNILIDNFNNLINNNNNNSNNIKNIIESNKEKMYVKKNEAKKILKHYTNLFYGAEAASNNEEYKKTKTNYGNIDTHIDMLDIYFNYVDVIPNKILHSETIYNNNKGGTLTYIGGNNYKFKWVPKNGGKDIILTSDKYTLLPP